MRKVFVFSWGFLLLLVLFYFVYLPVLSKYRTMKAEQEAIERKLSDLNSKIETLKEEKKLLQTDVQYLEKVIRDQMGLVKPGEVVYKFVNDEAKKSPVPVVSQSQTQETH